MKRLLLDQGLPHSAAALLTKKGWDVVHVADAGMSKAEDAEILQYALDTKRIVVVLAVRGSPLVMYTKSVMFIGEELCRLY